MPKETPLKEQFLPRDLDFSKVFPPKKRGRPTKSLEFSGEMPTGRTESGSIVNPKDKMLGKGSIAKDPLDGSSRPFKPPKVHIDLPMDDLTGSVLSKNKS